MTGAQASSPASYAYDGDGHRVKRIVGTTETWQVYGLGAELIAEYAANTVPSNPQKEYGYRNGELLITAEASANPRPNVALPVNGGSITVSSQFASYVAAYLTDGDRSGNGFRVWADSQIGAESLTLLTTMRSSFRCLKSKRIGYLSSSMLTVS